MVAGIRPACVLRTRLATAAVAIPLLIWLVLGSAPWVFAGVIVGFTAIGLGEFATMALPDHRLPRVLSIVAGLAFAAAVVSGRPAALGAVLFATFAGGLFLSLFDPDLPGAVGRFANGMVAALYVGFLLPHVVSLRMLPGGERWVFFAIACAMGSDTGAYFAGRYAGRTKLMPRVSPNKTVEGSIGGLMGSVVLAVFAWVVLPPHGERLEELLFLALAFSILAQAGDLIESALKRAYGAKDSGWIIPGHGGVLDRIDSLVLPFVFAYYVNA
ncbi:phosphatidate cytidylyltransferase [Candidatus Binatia bacterium]|nr:phosphatidate cytidylyltransferase [Candidatus Binatia bacterium]